jgi:hypothetical protein
VREEKERLPRWMGVRQMKVEARSVRKVGSHDFEAVAQRDLLRETDGG